MSGFILDRRLEAETILAVSLPLCDVLLRDDARTLWIIAVPRRAGLEEVHDLGAEDQAQLMIEIARISRAVAQIAQPTKVNTGMLGNIVRQLHVHVVARTEGDFAWPGPVWGVGERVVMEADARANMLTRVQAALSEAG